MREIKFRGQLLGTDKWIYGDLLTDSYDGEKRYFILPHKSNSFDEFMQVTPESVGQYTGLKDKNEKEIYEGDLVQLNGWGVSKKDDGITSIIWDIDENGWNFKLTNYAEDRYDFRKAINHCEVIGNIHEGVKKIN